MYLMCDTLDFETQFVSWIISLDFCNLILGQQILFKYITNNSVISSIIHRI